MKYVWILYWLLERVKSKYWQVGLINESAYLAKKAYEFSLMIPYIAEFNHVNIGINFEFIFINLFEFCYIEMD